MIPFLRNPHLSIFLDLSAVEGCCISAGCVEVLAERSTADVRLLAIIALRPVVFGMARMYQISANRLREHVGVFREPSAADRWLNAFN